MRRLIVFDDGLESLAPLNDLRASFDIRTGALTTLERLRASVDGEIVGLSVPDALLPLTRQAHPWPVNAPVPRGEFMLYNGRCPIPPYELPSLRVGDAIVEKDSGDLVAAMVQGTGEKLSLTPPSRAAAREVPHCLLSRPWHARRFRDEAIRIDLEILARPARRTPDEPSAAQELFEVPGEGVGMAGAGEGPQPLHIGGHPLTIDPTARVYPGAILDMECGPIVIAAHAVIRPGAIVIGPAYIGPSSTVLERATIRPNTAIGPCCKVNGEIGGTIFQGYANKAHDGYLGDSWVGEWVNLGAGTTNSNLLNTYGEITALRAPGQSHERTGEQFLGAVMGDHVKTAICTRLGTGCVVHTGAMLATTAPVNGSTPTFAWATDQGLRRYRLDKFLDVVRAMMTRRSTEPSAAYLARLTALHAATSPA